MIKVTRTITLDGQTVEEYQKIITHLEQTNSEQQGWRLTKDPLMKRVTAYKQEEIQQL